MYLTREEERILNGEEGEAKQLALKLIVRVGEALGAERLVEIEHAHVSGVSYSNIGEEGLAFIRSLYEMGARFSVFTTFNPAGVPLGGEPASASYLLRKQAEVIRYLILMGAKYTATCVPYELRKPRVGEHLAWGESSAVAVANSVYGARTNREAGPIALAAAIVGRTYLWGLHLDSEREPDTLVELGFKPTTELEGGLAGYVVADYVPSAKLYVKAQAKPTPRAAIAFCAAAAAHGSIALAYFEGLSPEKLPEPRRPRDRIHVSREDIVRYAERVSCADAEQAEVLFMGCPHYGPSGFDYLVSRLETALTKLIAVLPRLREVWIAVPGYRWRRYSVPRELYVAGRRLRLKLLPGTCIVVGDRRALPVLATNSVKTAIYLCKAGVPTALVEVGV